MDKSCVVSAPCHPTVLFGMMLSMSQQDSICCHIAVNSNVLSRPSRLTVGKQVQAIECVDNAESPLCISGQWSHSACALVGVHATSLHNMPQCGCGACFRTTGSGSGSSTAPLCCYGISSRGGRECLCAGTPLLPTVTGEGRNTSSRTSVFSLNQ